MSKLNLNLKEFMQDTSEISPMFVNMEGVETTPLTFNAVNSVTANKELDTIGGNIDNLANVYNSVAILSEVIDSIDPSDIENRERVRDSITLLLKVDGVSTEGLSLEDSMGFKYISQYELSQEGVGGFLLAVWNAFATMFMRFFEAIGNFLSAIFGGGGSGGGGGGGSSPAVAKGDFTKVAKESKVTVDAVKKEGTDTEETTEPESDVDPTKPNSFKVSKVTRDVSRLPKYSGSHLANLIAVAGRSGIVTSEVTTGEELFKNYATWRYFIEDRIMDGLGVISEMDKVVEAGLGRLIDTLTRPISNINDIDKIHSEVAGYVKLIDRDLFKVISPTSYKDLNEVKQDAIPRIEDMIKETVGKGSKGSGMGLLFPEDQLISAPNTFYVKDYNEDGPELKFKVLNIKSYRGESVDIALPQDPDTLIKEMERMGELKGLDRLSKDSVRLVDKSQKYMKRILDEVLPNIEMMASNFSSNNPASMTRVYASELLRQIVSGRLKENDIIRPIEKDGELKNAPLVGRIRLKGLAPLRDLRNWDRLTEKEQSDYLIDNYGSKTRGWRLIANKLVELKVLKIEGLDGIIQGVDNDAVEKYRGIDKTVDRSLIVTLKMVKDLVDSISRVQLSYIASTNAEMKRYVDFAMSKQSLRNIL